MFKYIEFNFKKKHLIILFFIIIRYIHSFILDKYVPIKNQNERNIIELNNFFGFLYFIIPYIYIKCSTQAIKNNNEIKPISFEKKKMKYIIINKGIYNLSIFSRFYLLIVNGILYFFVYIIIYYSSYNLRKEKYFQYYYEFYPLSLLFLLKYFFNYDLKNFHYIYFISLITFFFIRLIFCFIFYSNKILHIFFNLFIMFVERFVISFTMVLIQYLNQIVFINNYLIIFFIGISSSICGILFFYLSSMEYYIINFASFLLIFCIIIKFYLLLMIIDNFNALYIGLASCISITFEHSKFDNYFYYIYEVSFIFFNMLSLLIFCEIIIINIKGLNLKTIKNLEIKAKKEFDLKNILKNIEKDTNSNRTEIRTESILSEIEN